MAAMQSPVLAFFGRLLLAFLFLSSGLQKLQSFDIATGGPVMAQMAPKMDLFVTKTLGFVKEQAVKHGLDDKLGPYLSKPPLHKEHYPYILGFAIFLEVAGSLLFVLDKAIGAQMLILFTIPVTLIMHAFWDLPANSQEQFIDMVMCFKNVALVGALLMYLGMKPSRGAH